MSVRYPAYFWRIFEPCGLVGLRLQICGQRYGQSYNEPASVYVRITPYTEMRMRSAVLSCVLRIAYVRISYP